MVGAASDGSQAIDRIRALVPDVAVLDINMPGLGGIEVVEEARRTGSTTRIVLLTMLKAPAAAHRALGAGASGYVLKDDAFDDLLRAVRAVHAGERFISPSVGAQLDAAELRGEPSPHALSPRELEVLRFIAEGYSTQEIAEALQIRARTVETYRERIMEKLDLHKSADLVRYAVSAGLVDA